MKELSVYINPWDFLCLHTLSIISFDEEQMSVYESFIFPSSINKLAQRHKTTCEHIFIFINSLA